MNALQHNGKRATFAALGILSALIGICPVAIMAYAVTDADNSMQSSGIVPDVVDSLGNGTVQVIYADDLHVCAGNELTPRQVRDQPLVRWPVTDAASFYTLLLCDPDAPSSDDPTMREVLHWCVVNVPGGDVANGGDTLFEYIGSGAPENTGLHRYVFLVFRQPGGRQTFDEERVPRTSRKNRRQTSARTFAQRHRLGNPVAVNYFRAQFDDYVPIFQSSESQNDSLRNASHLTPKYLLSHLIDRTYQAFGSLMERLLLNSDRQAKQTPQTVSAAAAMNKSSIVPELCDDYGATELRIVYADQPPLQFGQLLRTDAVRRAPAVSWSADPQAFYTLLMSDPDAPAHWWPFLGEVRHWLVANIPGADVAAGQTLSEYLPSGPPPLTGTHRYVFVLFAQPAGRIEFGADERTSGRLSRFRTSIRTFATKYQLGAPIGANLFAAKY